MIVKHLHFCISTSLILVVLGNQTLYYETFTISLDYSLCLYVY
jgi:hypothetical protein